MKFICKATYCSNYDHDEKNCSFDEVILDLHSGYSDNIVHCNAFVDISPKCKRCQWGNPLATGYRAECMFDGKICDMDDYCNKYKPEESCKNA